MYRVKTTECYKVEQAVPPNDIPTSHALSTPDVHKNSTTELKGMTPPDIPPELTLPASSDYDNQRDSDTSTDDDICPHEDECDSKIVKPTSTINSRPTRQRRPPDFLKM